MKIRPSISAILPWDRFTLLNALGWLVFMAVTFSAFKILFNWSKTALVQYFVVECLWWSFLLFLNSMYIKYLIDQKYSATVQITVFMRQISGRAILSIIVLSILMWVVLWPLYDHMMQVQTPFFEQIAIIVVTNFSWAVYLAAWALFYISYKLYKDLNDNTLRIARMEQSLKEAQLNTLKGQINPHFMFNTLNNIRGLILEDSYKARDMLTNLSEVIRYSLSKEQQNFIKLADEIEVVERFIALSKIQFEQRLQYQQVIDPTCLNLQIPPMMIQMLVENAVKHGISKLPGGGVITLDINCVNNQLRIEVCNDGKLQTDADSTQIGVENIRRRLDLLYSQQASFDLSEQTNKVIATLIIPIQ